MLYPIRSSKFVQIDKVIKLNEIEKDTDLTKYELINCYMSSIVYSIGLLLMHDTLEIHKIIGVSNKTLQKMIRIFHLDQFLNQFNTESANNGNQCKARDKKNKGT